MAGIGLDCGTVNIVCARRGQEDKVDCRSKVNAFVKIPLENRYTFNMLKKADVPMIERPKAAFVVGKPAVDMAYTMNLDLCRPMKDGTLNPTEPDAFEILKVMIHSLIGEVRDKDVCYYCVPADAVNA